MNKRQLIAAAARRSSLNRGQMGEALDAILETITEEMTRGEAVAVCHFGRFETQIYPGRNLRRFAGEGHFAVEGRRVPVFRSSAVLRRRVRGGKPS